MCRFEDLLYDSEDEMDHNQFSKNVVAKKRNKGGGAWIKESDRPIDFLDSSVNQHVLGKQVVTCLLFTCLLFTYLLFTCLVTDPTLIKKHKQSSNDFVFSTDGKLIIDEATQDTDG